MKDRVDAGRRAGAEALAQARGRQVFRLLNMKTIIFILIGSTVFCCCISNARQQNGKESKVAAERIDTVNYNSDLLPILQKKCSPCHFPGGKMYERMPFDNPVTILNHQTGILKRMKDQPEAALIKQFVEQHNKGN